MNELMQDCTQIRIFSIREKINYLKKEYLQKEHPGEDISENLSLLTFLENKEMELCNRLWGYQNDN